MRKLDGDRAALKINHLKLHMCTRMCIYMHIFMNVNAHTEKRNAQRRHSHIGLYSKSQHFNQGIPMLSP